MIPWYSLASLSFYSQATSKTGHVLPITMKEAVYRRLRALTAEAVRFQLRSRTCISLTACHSCSRMTSLQQHRLELLHRLLLPQKRQ